MARKRKGERRRNGKWEVYVRVNGHLYSDTLPGSATTQERDDWRDDKQQKHGTCPTVAGSFAADIKAHVPTVAALVNLKPYTRHLDLWMHELGRDRTSLSVTYPEIDVVIQKWINAGLAPGTIRGRVFALQSFFGKTFPDHVNPVKRARKPKAAKPENRGLPYELVGAALAAMALYRDTKRGLPPRFSLARIRARVMAYSGLPPSLIKTVRARDLDYTAGTVRIVPRHKGDGVEARTLKLSDDALAAFRDLEAAGGLGVPFRVEPINRGFKRALVKIGLPADRARAYDLRHSFLREVYRLTRDLATVARLAIHAPGSPVTARYAMGANDEVDAAAVAAFTAARAAAPAPAPVPESVPKLAAKVGRRRKSFTVTRLVPAA